MGMGGSELLILGCEGARVWDFVSFPGFQIVEERPSFRTVLVAPRRSGAADAFWRLLNLADLAEELSVVGAAPLGPAAAELFDAFVEEVHRGLPGGLAASDRATVQLLQQLFEAPGLRWRGIGWPWTSRTACWAGGMWSC